jgi:hypothetical protein
MPKRAGNAKVTIQGITWFTLAIISTYCILNRRKAERSDFKEERGKESKNSFKRVA